MPKRISQQDRTKLSIRRLIEVEFVAELSRDILNPTQETSVVSLILGYVSAKRYCLFYTMTGVVPFNNCSK